MEQHFVSDAGIEKTGKDVTLAVGDDHDIDGGLLEKSLNVVEEIVLADYLVVDFPTGIVRLAVVANTGQLYFGPGITFFGQMEEPYAKGVALEQAHEGIERNQVLLIKIGEKGDILDVAYVRVSKPFGDGKYREISIVDYLGRYASYQVYLLPGLSP